jgi:hypothetical protein
VDSNQQKISKLPSTPENLSKEKYKRGKNFSTNLHIWLAFSDKGNRAFCMAYILWMGASCIYWDNQQGIQGLENQKLTNHTIKQLMNQIKLLPQIATVTLNLLNKFDKPFYWMQT